MIGSRRKKGSQRGVCLSSRVSQSSQIRTHENAIGACFDPTLTYFLALAAIFERERRARACGWLLFVVEKQNREKTGNNNNTDS